MRNALLVIALTAFLIGAFAYVIPISEDTSSNQAAQSTMDSAGNYTNPEQFAIPVSSLDLGGKISVIALFVVFTSLIAACSCYRKEKNLHSCDGKTSS